MIEKLSRQFNTQFVHILNLNGISGNFSPYTSTIFVFISIVCIKKL